MCLSCYEEYGSPSVINEKVRAVLPLIKEVFDWNDMGGNLHVELDDYNLKDIFFEDEFKPWDPNVSAERLQAEKACYDALKNMTEDERVSAVAIYDGYIELEGYEPQGG